MLHYGERIIITSSAGPVEVSKGVIKLRCPKCGHKKPLTSFGLRKMAEGTIRNQPNCSDCRSRASKRTRSKTKKLSA